MCLVAININAIDTLKINKPDTLTLNNIVPPAGFPVQYEISDLYYGLDSINGGLRNFPIIFDNSPSHTDGYYIEETDLTSGYLVSYYEIKNSWVYDTIAYLHVYIKPDIISFTINNSSSYYYAIQDSPIRYNIGVIDTTQVDSVFIATPDSIIYRSNTLEGFFYPDWNNNTSKQIYAIVSNPYQSDTTLFPRVLQVHNERIFNSKDVQLFNKTLVAYKQIKVYSITGKLIYEGTGTFYLESGIYIIIVNNTSYKVII
jgi:hypothetical protein